MICPVCNKEFLRLCSHLFSYKDLNHQEFLNNQINLIKDLFNNLEFTKHKNLLEDFGIYLSYDKCLEIWRENFSKEERRNRANKLDRGDPRNKGLTSNTDSRIKNNINKTTKKSQENINYIECKICNKKFNNLIPHLKIHNITHSDYKEKYNTNILYHKSIYEKVSKTMANKIPNYSRGLSGIRKDIGHHATSTYEANIYRILQYKNKKYKREHECIYPININGKIKYYRIDICDIEGLFGIPGAFIEVKGFMKNEDRIKIQEFRKQYPDEKLLVLGYGDKRLKYFWKPDIDLHDLELKYRKFIPLWEDRYFNIKANPEIFKLEKNIDYTNKIICPICGQIFSQNFLQHLHKCNDKLHQEFLNNQISLIKELFYNLNFNTNSNIKDYNIMLNYFNCLKIWKQYFTNEQLLQRSIQLTKNGKLKNIKEIVQIECPICHRKFNKIHIHIATPKDHEHELFYQEHINRIINLYYDQNFTSESNPLDFNIYSSYRKCEKIWKKNINGEHIIPNRKIYQNNKGE